MAISVSHQRPDGYLPVGRPEKLKRVVSVPVGLNLNTVPHVKYGPHIFVTFPPTELLPYKFPSWSMITPPEGWKPWAKSKRYSTVKPCALACIDRNVANNSVTATAAACFRPGS